MDNKEKHSGGCACGKVRYHSIGQPVKTGLCHCRYCQLRTGTAFGISVYFGCMMVGAMKTIQVTLSVILGAILGPLFFFITPEWSILFGGFTAGTIAFFVGELNDK